MTDTALTLPDRPDNEHYRLYIRDRHVSLLYKIDTIKRGLEALAPQPHWYGSRDEEAFLKAMTEHARRLYKLDALKQELSAITSAIDPVEQREVGRRRRATEESKED